MCFYETTPKWGKLKGFALNSKSSLFLYKLLYAVISMFYGLIVAMYYLDSKQHNYPHIHDKYGEHEAVIKIPGGELLEGELPGGKMKLMNAWIEIHKDELMANWELAVKGNEIFKIDPLK